VEQSFDNLSTIVYQSFKIRLRIVQQSFNNRSTIR